MNRSILISIKPEYVEKILNNTKTIEIRKTMPKCELPCKVYIYCTKPKKWYADSPFTASSDELLWKLNNQIYSGKNDSLWNPKFDEGYSVLNGRIVAEFTLNKVEKFDSSYSEWAYSVAPEGSKMPMNETQFIQISEQKGKLDCDDLLKYFGDEDYIAYMWHIDDLKIYDEPRELSEFTHWIYKLKKPPAGWCYVKENSDVKD